MIVYPNQYNSVQSQNLSLLQLIHLDANKLIGSSLRNQQIMHKK